MVRVSAKEEEEDKVQEGASNSEMQGRGGRVSPASGIRNIVSIYKVSSNRVYLLGVFRTRYLAVYVMIYEWCGADAPQVAVVWPSDVGLAAWRQPTIRL